MTYGWCDGKYVLLVQKEKDGAIISRISMKPDEALNVSRSIRGSIYAKPLVYKNHEQI